MKAKVIETGEIVEVVDYNDSKVTVYRNDETEFFAQNEYSRDEVEFLPDTREKVIEGWVAVDKSGCAYLFNKKPMRFGSCWYEDQNNAGRYRLWTFNDITDLNWIDEPLKVKITITPME